MRRPLALAQALILSAALVGTAGASPAAAADTFPRPLGTVTALGGSDPQCGEGQTCAVYQVSGCPEVAAARKLYVATRRPPPEVATRGVVVLLSGGSGKTYWVGDGAGARAWMDHVVAAGMIVAQLRFQGKWYVTKPGELAGPGAVTCWPATMIKSIHDTLYAPLGLDPEAGRCGFCLVGSSMGTTIPSYTLDHFGLETILDGVFVTGGPVHAGMLQGCRGEGFGYGKNAKVWVDPAYGYLQSGPCKAHNLSEEWRLRWTEDGLDTAGDHGHPTTRVHIFIGERDTSMHRRGQRWREVLVAAGTPDVTLRIVPGMGHSIKGSQAGMDELEASVLR